MTIRTLCHNGFCPPLFVFICLLLSFSIPLPQRCLAADEVWQGIVVSYNIRHGQGMDGKLDLERTANVLKELSPDFVGLQEVDKGVSRSGSVDQPEFLAKKLGMNPAFGKFMDYDGGQYGLAILSKHPILESEVIELPRGNEPRVALAALVQIPNGEKITVVNLHFDWVNDDRFRYAQASKLREHLDRLKTPYLLLGDFNDQSGSRTLDLLGRDNLEAVKPTENRFTFPAKNPDIEIDFLFGSPKNRWEFLETMVVPETMASDHRPIRTTFRLQFP
ncbi:MAG: endonuclease/exonuclease/phosphatase family protein [Pirellula sp.]|jgi:endonuclease/exonuclease/phosphatase family metal-dependent hydrolase|nr:endonuclease/exonuclease/phosphatase family protein [Pirellula sp.]